MKEKELLAAMGLREGDLGRRRHSFPQEGWSPIAGFETVEQVIDPEDLEREDTMVLVRSENGEVDEVTLGELIDDLDPSGELVKLPSDYMPSPQVSGYGSGYLTGGGDWREVELDPRTSLRMYAENRSMGYSIAAYTKLSNFDDDAAVRKGIDSVYWAMVEAVALIREIAKAGGLESAEDALSMYVEYRRARDSDGELAVDGRLESMCEDEALSLSAIDSCLNAVAHFLRRFEWE